MTRAGDAFLLATSTGYAFGAVLGVDPGRGTAYVQLQIGHRGAIPLPHVETGKALLARVAEEVAL